MTKLSSATSSSSWQGSQGGTWREGLFRVFQGMRERGDPGATQGGQRDASMAILTPFFWSQESPVASSASRWWREPLSTGGASHSCLLCTSPVLRCWSSALRAGNRDTQTLHHTQQAASPACPVGQQQKEKSFIYIYIKGKLFTNTS